MSGLVLRYGTPFYWSFPKTALGGSFPKTALGGSFPKTASEYDFVTFSETSSIGNLCQSLGWANLTDKQPYNADFPMKILKGRPMWILLPVYGSNREVGDIVYEGDWLHILLVNRRNVTRRDSYDTLLLYDNFNDENEKACGGAALYFYRNGIPNFPSKKDLSDAPAEYKWAIRMPGKSRKAVEYDEGFMFQNLKIYPDCGSGRVLNPYRDRSTFANNLYCRCWKNTSVYARAAPWISIDSINKCCFNPTSCLQSSDPNCKFGTSYGVSDYNACETTGTTVVPTIECTDYILNLCEREWNSGQGLTPGNNDVCSRYLGSMKNTLNARNAIAQTVYNYIKHNKYDPRDKFYSGYLSQLCNAVPGACDQTTIVDPETKTQYDSVIGAFCQGETRDTLRADPVKSGICGCFMPKTQDNYPYPGITAPQCDPICSIASKSRVPITRNVNGTFSPDNCTQTNCIIDGITINFIDSDSHATINQVCSNCKGGGCTCYIDKATVDEIRSKGNIDFNQACGSCQIFDGNDLSNPECVVCGTFKPCGSDNGGGGSQSLWDWLFDPQHRLATTISLILITGIILFVTFLIIYRKTKR